MSEKYFFQFVKKEDGTRSETMAGNLDEIKTFCRSVALPLDEFYVLILSGTSAIEDSDNELFSRFPLMMAQAFCKPVTESTEIENV